MLTPFVDFHSKYGGGGDFLLSVGRLAGVESSVMNLELCDPEARSVSTTAQFSDRHFVALLLLMTHHKQIEFQSITNPI